jgi:hypothetical protein
LNGWTIHRTGWSRTKPEKLTEIVHELASRLGEAVGNIPHWTNPGANELGLDLLCYRPFPDARVGVPVYLLQCASGANWHEKLHTPQLEIWSKIIQFVATPRKAFAIPFALVDGDFVRKCALVGGLLIDRYRLLAATCVDDNWLSGPLRARLIAWLSPRIDALPLRG